MSGSGEQKAWSVQRQYVRPTTFEGRKALNSRHDQISYEEEQESDVSGFNLNLIL